MKLYYEEALRQQADEPTITLLELWHTLCKEKTGTSIEVMITRRKEHPRFAHFQGELHTAIPQMVAGKPVLVLIMDFSDEVNEVLVTHELGHWVLRLQGYVALRCKRPKDSNTEIFLNSMAQHVPLYALQKSVGHDPQAEIDSRCLHNLKLYSKSKEAGTRQSWVDAALMLADDVLNCSPANRVGLMNVLSKRHLHVSGLVRDIMRQTSSHDLLTGEGNLAFARAVVSCLQLPGEWYVADDIGKLISMTEGN